jgi:hypothetical protein
MNAEDLHPAGAAATQRDFLYQRRLVSLRPFVTDDGVPGLNLRFAGGDTIAVRIEVPLLDLLHHAIGRLKACQSVKRPAELPAVRPVKDP